MKAYIFISLMHKVKEQVKFYHLQLPGDWWRNPARLHRYLFIYLFIFIVTKVQVNNAVIMK